MQGAEREVTLFARAHDHAKAVDVQHVGKGRMRIAHAVVDAVDRLVAPLHLRHDPGLGQRCARLAQNLFQHRLAVAARQNHVFAQDGVASRIVVEKGELLQFAKDGVKAQAVRDRHVNFQGLLGDAPALIRAHDAQGAQVVQAVGEFDKDHAHVAAHR